MHSKTTFQKENRRKRYQWPMYQMWEQKVVFVNYLKTYFIEVSSQISSCYEDIILTSFPLWSNHWLLIRGMGWRHYLFTESILLFKNLIATKVSHTCNNQYRLGRCSANEIGHIPPKSIVCWYSFTVSLGSTKIF